MKYVIWNMNKAVEEELNAYDLMGIINYFEYVRGIKLERLISLKDNEMKNHIIVRDISTREIYDIVRK